MEIIRVYGWILEYDDIRQQYFPYGKN